MGIYNIRLFHENLVFFCYINFMVGCLICFEQIVYNWWKFVYVYCRFWCLSSVLCEAAIVDVMGKGRSPGKWIRSLLSGGKKSSSKSSSSKKNDIFVSVFVFVAYFCLWFDIVWVLRQYLSYKEPIKGRKMSELPLIGCEYFEFWNRNVVIVVSIRVCRNLRVTRMHWDLLS